MIRQHPTLALAAGLALGVFVFGDPAVAQSRTLSTRSATAIVHSSLHPNLARGSSAVGRFDSDDLGAINLFNGNLRLALPLGQVFPVDSQLSYLFQLNYNSNIWSFTSGAGWVNGNPLPHSNAGLGFDLSFGRLLEPGDAANPTSQWIFVGSDGTESLFYSSLHHDTPDPNDPGDAVKYSRDGSFLRLVLTANGERRVERGNGVARVFAPVKGTWRLVRLESQAGNSVAFTYAADGSSWTLTDSHGRTATVSLISDPTGRYPKLISQLDLPAFGGARGIYTFNYTQATVARACADSRGGTESVPLLASITDPVGRVYNFEHYAAGADCFDAGRLKRAQLLSGGFFEWDYAAYTFPPASCAAPSPAHLTQGSGVVRKSKLQPSGAVVGNWFYTPELVAAASGCGADGRRTTVMTPLGDKTVFHFAAGTDAPSAGGPSQYGLPYAPTQPDALGQLYLSEEVFDCQAGGDSCVLARSRWARFDQDEVCGSTAGNCFDTNRRQLGAAEVFADDDPVNGVQRFRRYDWSDYDGLGNYRVRTQSSNFGRADLATQVRHTNSAAGNYPPGGFLGNVFTVPAPSEPWFLDDFTYTINTDDVGQSVRADTCYSAQGFLLRTRRRANAAAPSAGDVVSVLGWEDGERIAESRFGGDTQSLATTADLCVLPLPGSGFVVEHDYLYGTLARERRYDVDGTLVPYLTVDRDIDASTGKVSVTRDTTGLATTYLFDAAGRPTWERPEEGSWTEYVYAAPNGASGWNSGPNTTILERPNGNPYGVGLSTRIHFRDALGRSTGTWRSMPGGVTSGVRTLHNALDWKTHESTAYQVGNPTLFWTQYLNYDPFGRARTVRPPEGTAHDEVFVFKGEREEQVTRQAAKAYFNNGTPFCDEEPMVNVKRYDGLARVWYESSNEPEPLPGRLIETERKFAASGQVKEIVRRETVGASVKTDITEMSFDGRGFGLSTVLRNGAGRTISTTIRSEFDALGLHGREALSGDLFPGAGLATAIDYDALGRVLTIADDNLPTKLWKEFTYADENGPVDLSGRVDRRRGRLVEAVRHNYFELTHYEVIDQYSYRGLGGRPSERVMDIDTVSSASNELILEKSYRTTATYDELGNIATLGYPVCIECSAGEPTAPYTLTYNSSQGRVTSVTATRGTQTEPWLNSVTWSVAGQPFEVVHGNGVKDVHQPDPFREPRSGSVQVYGPTGDLRYDSGTIVYDGSGRVCGIGAEGKVQAPRLFSDDTAGPSPCDRAQQVDPFGRWNGYVTDEACTASRLGSVQIHDAQDRLVALLSRSALQKLTIAGEPYWVPDQARFEEVYLISTLDGQRMTEVRDQVTQGWLSTSETISSLGRSIGAVVQRASAPGFQSIYHHHPMMVFSTQPNGRPWPPGN